MEYASPLEHSRYSICVAMQPAYQRCMRSRSTSQNTSATRQTPTSTPMLVNSTWVCTRSAAEYSLAGCTATCSG